MAFSLAQMDTKDWMVVAATIVGPILAVQAQKWVEVFRERRNRKLRVFQQLMATRAARLSAEHVQGLNMIDLVFYGSHVLGIHHRSKTERTVIEAWREYHDHLSTKVTDAAIPVWNTQGEELFVNLLFAIAADVSFKFDRVQLKKGAYSPMAHSDLENEQTAIRRMALQLLSGNSALKMDVTKFPIDDDALKAQVALQKAMSGAFNGDGALNVRVKNDAAAT
jgi:hypothetical protein